MQFAKLLFVNGIGRSVHWTLCTLIFRKCNYITKTSGSGHDHHYPIKAEGYSAMWRCAVCKGVEEKSEFFTGFLLPDSKNPEHLTLYFRVMNPDRTSSNFASI